MLNLKLLAKLLDHLSIQILPIICNKLSWNVVAANDILFKKSGYHHLSNALIGSGFHPLSKVVDNH